MKNQNYIRNFTVKHFEKFLEKLNSFPDCKLTSSKLECDNGHFDSYKYISSGSKFALHHDKKGNILQLNADAGALENLLELAESVRNITDKESGQSNNPALKNILTDSQVPKNIPPKNPAKKRTEPVNKPAKNIPSKNPAPIKAPPSNLPADMPSKDPVSQIPAQRNTEPKGNPLSTDTVMTKPDKTVLMQNNRTNGNAGVKINKHAGSETPDKKSNIAGIKHKTGQKRQAEKQQENPPQIIEPEYKDGYCLKEYSFERFNGAIAALKKENGITVDKEESFNEGRNNHLIAHAVKDGSGSKINIQYTVKSKTVQIQGKRSDLFTKAQIIIANNIKDINSTVKAYIDYSRHEQNENRQAQPVPETAAKAGDKTRVKGDITTKGVLKELKKKIPYAFDYLSETEKAQLTFTMIDLNSNVRNYSGVLLPAYITLEQIISTLQKKENIIVKMIGQAFDKDEERYVLKPGYVKKSKSVIYVEVLCSLYNEYNKRHKYMHTDLSGGMMNIISDRTEAKAIFDDMMEIIDYNFRKLSEIRYNNK